MANMELMIPKTMPEQRQIGEYFQIIDHFITLHHRKCINFTDLAIFDWEQRKLSEVVKEIKRTDETSNAPVMMITAENGFINQSERYSTNNAGQSLKKYIILERGELAYNHGASKLRPFGSCFSLTTEEKARIPFVYHCFSSETENAEFLSIELNGKAVESQLRRIVSSGARMDGLLNISFQEYTSIPILLPERSEQDKIASYFCQLDHLITLHQRILGRFAKKQAYVWEQRKFGEVVEKYEDPVDTPTDGYVRLGIRSHAKGTFHNYVEKGKELETAKMFRVAANKFIVNITFGWEHAVAITDETDAGKLVSHRFPQYSFKEGMVPKFFRYLILDENFKHHLELSSPGGAGRNRVLKLNEMLEYKMSFPSKEEQKKIASYFDSLDHLITLHQRECDELQNIKKYMLQNMFV